MSATCGDASSRFCACRQASNQVDELFDSRRIISGMYEDTTAWLTEEEEARNVTIKVDVYLFRATFPADYGDFADPSRSSPLYNRYVVCARSLTIFIIVILIHTAGLKTIADRKVNRVGLRTRKNKRFNAFPKPNVNSFPPFATTYLNS